MEHFFFPFFYIQDTLIRIAEYLARSDNYDNLERKRQKSPLPLTYEKN